MAGNVESADGVAGPVVLRPLEEQAALQVKRTHEMFAANHGARVMESEGPRKLRMAIKTVAEYGVVKDLPPPQQPVGEKLAAKPVKNQPAAAPEGEDADAKAHLRKSAVEKVVHRISP